MSLRIFRLFFPGWRASTWKCAPAQHLWSPFSFSLQQSGTSDPLFGPTRDVFFNERKNHHYLLFPNKKNFYVRPKITLNSHLTQNYIGYTTCGLICARAQCSFDLDKARQTSRVLPAIYSTEQSSSFSSWSWLRCFLKSLFTFNLNLPESLKQRCTVCTTTRLKLSANSLPIRHQAEVVCQFNFSLVVQRRFKRPLITSRQSTQSYASRERNLWGKSLKSRASRAVLVKSETPEA